MEPSTAATTEPFSPTITSDRLVLLRGEADRAPHPAGENRTAASEAIPRGFFDATLLLLVGEEPDHGYDLAARLARLGFHSIDMGIMYRHLRRLERGGLLASEWAQPVSGPARRVYRLTPEGSLRVAAFAVTAHQARRQLAGFLNRFRTAELA